MTQQRQMKKPQRRTIDIKEKDEGKNEQIWINRNHVV